MGGSGSQTVVRRGSAHTHITSLLVFFMITSAIALPRTTTEKKCYNPKSDFYPFMSTKTAYEYVHAAAGRPESTCYPIQMWVLARHGTRYPDEDKINRLLNLTKIRDEMLGNNEREPIDICDKDLSLMRDWKPDEDMNSSNAEMLTPQGKIDLFDLARRLKVVFADLLKDYSPENFFFRSTIKDRARDSMIAFASGMFPDEQVTFTDPPENDTLLLLHEGCPAWESTFKKDNVLAEMKSFKAGPEVQNVLTKLSRRLGYEQILDYDTVSLMYEMCIYETAWNVKNHTTNGYVSPWCIVFSKEELQVFEYVKDLDYFYCCGPGRKMSKKIGCQPLADMFHHFEKLESDDESSQQKGIFYFAHSQTIQTFLAALDINDDSAPITSKNYALEDNRKYRTSLQGSFASNFVAVFYKCSGIGEHNKVMMYVGEKAVTPKGCKQDLCDWKDIKKELRPTVENCGTEFCWTTENSASQLGHGFKFVLGLIVSLTFFGRIIQV